MYENGGDNVIVYVIACAHVAALAILEIGVVISG
jgi:hypothetical protein